MLGTRERIFPPRAGRARSPAPASRTWLCSRDGASVVTWGHRPPSHLGHRRKQSVGPPVRAYLKLCPQGHSLTLPHGQSALRRAAMWDFEGRVGSA